MKLPLEVEVARWEFGRYFKLKDQLIALVTMIVVGAGAIGIAHLVRRSAAEPVRLAIVGPAAAALAAELTAGPDLPAGASFAAEAPAEAPEALRAGVETGEWDGLLLLSPAGEAELQVRRVPDWAVDLRARLDERARARRVAQSGLDRGWLAELLAPAPLEIVALDRDAGSRRGGALVAGIAIGLMLLGVLMGSAYLLVGITGEKQLRITEQVVAAIRPQTWIDGKILGLSALTLASLALYVVPAIAGMALLRRFGVPVPALPSAVVDPGFLAALMLFSALGFLLWFTFFAAIAATVDDPNNSSRGGWLMFPLLPLGLAFVVVRTPDSIFAHWLGLLPPTAPTVMPVRLLLGSVAVWEIVVSVAALIGTIWLLRRTAGKIFHLGMLIYGKEPTWTEIWRWAREVE